MLCVFSVKYETLSFISKFSTLSVVIKVNWNVSDDAADFVKGRAFDSVRFSVNSQSLFLPFS